MTRLPSADSAEVFLALVAITIVGLAFAAFLN